MTKVFFYPHAYLRDRQIDVICRWPNEQVINKNIVDGRRGAQVTAEYANSKKLCATWKQRLPLLNIKFRPKGISSSVVVYVWGAIIATGNFIVDLDNPWSMVGYNLRAMPIYRRFIKRVLLSNRCREIRCMSGACRNSLRELFGEQVYDKAGVHYPCIAQRVSSVRMSTGGICRFLFVGTQFEIKGGVAMLRAFSRVYEKHGGCRLDVITHLPVELDMLARSCEGVKIHAAQYSREEIQTHYMQNADVLVLPTYVESFGMVALEALANGLALIVTDVYALGEMAIDGVNGNLLSPPISVWDGVMPSSYYYDLSNIKMRIRSTDQSNFELCLEQAIERFVTDPSWKLRARKASIKLMENRFAC